MAPAISRSRTAGSKSPRARAQPVEVQGRALGGGDDVGGRARPRRFREFDDARRVQRLGDALDGGQRLGRGAALEIAAGDRDAQARRCRAPSAAAPARPAVWRRPDRRDRGPAWRRRRAPGRASSAPAAPDDRGSPRTGRCGRATAGHRSASGRTGRRARTARGSSRWCRSRARAAPARRPPRRRSRPTSRRSCGSVSCGLREGPSCTFSPVKS